MKLNKKKVILVVIIFIFCIFTIVTIVRKGKSKNFENEYEKVDKNQISYQENATVEDLKKDISAQGDSEIYEIQTEYDGRKILAVKATIKFKVAFAGLIKNSKPNLSEIDDILNNNMPKKDGIWIEENSKDAVLKLFNNSDNTNSIYVINEDGYLQISEKNKPTDVDKKIKKMIDSKKKYILSVSSLCYIVDELTGEILDYNFEEMDKKQVYEPFAYDDNIIMFITENKDNQLSNEEILNSLVSID